MPAFSKSFLQSFAARCFHNQATTSFLCNGWRYGGIERDGAAIRQRLAVEKKRPVGPFEQMRRRNGDRFDDEGEERARMAKSADAQDLKSCEVLLRVGSTPTPGTPPAAAVAEQVQIGSPKSHYPASHSVGALLMVSGSPSCHGVADQLEILVAELLHRE